MNPDSKPRSSWSPPSLAELQALLPAYQFLALIGRGGMGAVFQATQLSLNRRVAIKVLPTKLMEDADANFAARFRQEALTMAKLAHPGIVSVFESGEAGGLLYIVMEFVDGTDVARMIAAEGKLAPELATRMLTQVCEALHYAHECGVIHRDIKPANLLLTRDGTVKIADFGLAKHDDAALQGLTKTNVAIGTPDFLAPEAWTPNTTLDGRADVYALGVTLYQMLTGEIPRGFWEMPSARVGTDARFDAIIERALQPKPEARYQSSAELRRDLERIQAEPEQGGSAHAVGGVGASSSHSARLSSPVPSDVRRVGTRWGILVAAVGLLALAAFFWPHPPKPVPLPAEAVPPVNVPPDDPGPRAAAQWLLDSKAEFKISHGSQERDVTSEQDLPAAGFAITKIKLDRFGSNAPLPTDADFAVLREVKSLRQFLIHVRGLSDNAFAFLADNPQLNKVGIEGTAQVTDGVLAHLSGIKNLRYLDIIEAPRFRGRGLADAAWIESIERAGFGNTGLDDEALRVLALCPRLFELNMWRTPITAAGLEALSNGPKLKRMIVDNTAQITDAEFAAVLPRFHSLEYLRMFHSNGGDETATAISTMTNLVYLGLSHTKLTDAGLARLATMSRLEELELLRVNVSDAAVAAFEKARPRCLVRR